MFFPYFFRCFFKRSPCGHSRLGSTICNFGTWKLGHLSRVPDDFIRVFPEDGYSE